MKMNKSKGHTSSNGNMRGFAENSIKIPAELLKNLEIEQRIQISSTTSRNHSSFESTVQMLTCMHDDCMVREDSSTQNIQFLVAYAISSTEQVLKPVVLLEKASKESTGLFQVRLLADLHER